MSNYLTYYNAGMIVLIAILTGIIPKFTRKDIAFGVTIPESEKDEMPIKHWIKVYISVIIIFGIILFISIIIISIKDEHMIVLLGGSLSLQLIVYYGAYFVFHRKVKQLKAASNWKVERQTKVVAELSLMNRKIKFSMAWYLIYLIIIFITVLISLLVFDQLPQALPIHYNEYGQVDRLMNKEMAIYMLPLAQLFLSFVMFMGYVGINRSRLTIDPEDKEGSALRQKIYRTRMAMMIYVIGLSVITTLFISQLFIVEVLKDSQLVVILSGLVILAMVLALIIIIRYTGQSRWKVNKKKPSSNTIKRDDDIYYKLGLIYFNPKDPALLVEKRFGIGWTFNFGNPISWVLMIVIIIIIIVLI